MRAGWGRIPKVPTGGRKGRVRDAVSLEPECGVETTAPVARSPRCSPGTQDGPLEGVEGRRGGGGGRRREREPCMTKFWGRPKEFWTLLHDHARLSCAGAPTRVRPLPWGNSRLTSAFTSSISRSESPRIVPRTAFPRLKLRHSAKYDQAVEFPYSWRAENVSSQAFCSRVKQQSADHIRTSLRPPNRTSTPGFLIVQRPQGGLIVHLSYTSRIVQTRKKQRKISSKEYKCPRIVLVHHICLTGTPTHYTHTPRRGGGRKKDHTRTTR